MSFFYEKGKEEKNDDEKSWRGRERKSSSFLVVVIDIKMLYICWSYFI
jgi:hypothetical protein